MHAFESGYVTLFNKRHTRTGPLFQGRFGAVLVVFENHARVLSRYEREGSPPQWPDGARRRKGLDTIGSLTGVARNGGQRLSQHCEPLHRTQRPRHPTPVSSALRWFRPQHRRPQHRGADAAPLTCFIKDHGKSDDQSRNCWPDRLAMVKFHSIVSVQVLRVQWGRS